MGVGADIQVYGVRDALRELGQIDKKQRFRAINKMKAASGELVALGRSSYPAEQPMRGWTKGTRGGRLGYDKNKVDKGVQVTIGGRSFGNTYSLVTLVQKDAGGALFDIAGLQNGDQGYPSSDRLGRPRQKAQTDAFLANLNADYGKAQRGMWRKIKLIQEAANDRLMQALEEIVAEVNRKLVA